MSLPALKQIRRSFPKTHVTLLVIPWVSGIYEECKAVDEVLIYDRDGEHRGLGGKIKLLQALRKRKFDAAILFQNAFEADLLAALARIPVRAGYHRDSRGWLLSHPVLRDPRVFRLHQTYYYLDLVDQLLNNNRMALSSLAMEPCSSENPEMPDITMEVSTARRQLAQSMLKTQGANLSKTIVGVNPGAFYGSAKRWLSDRYAAVLDQLIEQEEAEVVIFGAANEVSIARSIETVMRRRPVILSGKTKLSELIAMIACCDLFITNDSGPMHLAAALRIPTVALFGSTDEIATGPLSPRAIVLNKKVECSPCLLRECPIDHRCMTRIGAEEVYQRAVEMLSLSGNKEPFEGGESQRRLY